MAAKQRLPFPGQSLQASRARAQTAQKARREWPMLLN